jgi:hypothetical protein
MPVVDGDIDGDLGNAREFENVACEVTPLMVQNFLL